MSDLRDIALVQASVPETATFGDAARALSEHRLGAIAVVDERGRVRGLFTANELLRGLYPPYLAELKHTAFLEDDPERLTERAIRCRDETVTRHMRKAGELDIETSTWHAAERFLHSEVDALPVVEDGRFLGMLPRAEFAFAMLRRFGDAAPQS